MERTWLLRVLVIFSIIKKKKSDVDMKYFKMKTNIKLSNLIMIVVVSIARMIDSLTIYQFMLT